MKEISCEKQQELDEALKLNDSDVSIVLIGDGIFSIYGSSQVRAFDRSQVRAFDRSQVRAYESSQVRAYGSSQVRAYESSQVTAYGSSQVTAFDSSQVTAYESSQVRAYESSQVTAYESSQVRAYESSQVRASKYVAVTVHGDKVKVRGGVRIDVPEIFTPDEWCEFYGVDIKRGIATLFKAVRDNYESMHGVSYAPGTKPVALDWDGGKAECGGGLHFSPRPMLAAYFDDRATRYIACGVRVSEIVVYKGARDPNKVKAPRVVRACVEVDIDGVTL